MPTPIIYGNRYTVLNILGQGGMGVVYRAYDRLENQIVALKRLIYSPDVLEQLDQVGVDMRISLAREFQVLATLRHPHIISVLDYGFDENNQPFFTMELLEGVLTIVDYGRQQDADAREMLVLQMLQAISYLHRRGVLHRDIKPDNVLVSVDGALKLADFGLASARKQVTDGISLGSIPYMAPELLDGQSATEQSDLYAVGLVAYEMLAGRYPFRLTGMMDDLIEDISTIEPSVDELEATPALRQVLARLLAKRASERFPTAESALQAYSQSAALRDTQETALVRESFLQAADFVGRERELATLTNALDSLSVSAQGSAWLIGGESGVGKTRLLNELRIQALVRGIVVVQAQATTESRAPFRFWRDALRALLLIQPIDDFEGGVLKTIIPDLETLLERDIPDAPPLDGQAAQDRLVNVIESIFARLMTPVLFILEDLQWLQDGLSIIQRLSRSMDDRPLVLVGSYRDDEKPDLPLALPDLRRLHLSRLQAYEISLLIASMLGESNAHRPELVQYLMNQTEGNVFFLVETVRALAEEAGQLSAVGQVDLPAGLLAQGVKNVVARRLERIAPQDRELLNLAALAGRALDLEVLQACAPHIDLTQWLDRCASVFEAQGTGWRFAHDKLREGALLRLDSERLPALHRQLAQAIETVHGADPDYYAAQANHWGGAQDADKEREYSLLAGEQALRQGAYAEALSRLQRAETLARQADDLPPLWRARLARFLADACIGVGLWQENIAYLQQALAALGDPSGATLNAEARNLMSEIQLELGYNYIELTTDSLGGIEYIRQAAALQERYGDSLSQADCYAMLAVILMTGQQQAEASSYAERAAELLEGLTVEAQRLSTLARATSNLAYYWTFAARWTESVRDGERAALLYQQIGDLIRWRATLMNLAASYEWRGDLQRGLTLRLQEYDIAQRGNNITGQIRALAGIGQMQAQLGQLEEARHSLEQRAELISRLSNSPSTRYTYLGMVYLRLGRLDEARALLPRALREMSRVGVPSAHDMFSISNTSELLLGLWEAFPQEAAQWQEAAEHIAHLAHEYGLNYLAGKSLMMVYEGRFAWLYGHHAQAMSLWEEAYSLAQIIGTPYAQALAAYETGRHLPLRSPQRQERLEIARNLLALMQARYYQRLAEQALDE